MEHALETQADNGRRNAYRLASAFCLFRPLLNTSVFARLSTLFPLIETVSAIGNQTLRPAMSTPNPANKPTSPAPSAKPPLHTHREAHSACAVRHVRRQMSRSSHRPQGLEIFLGPPPLTAQQPSLRPLRSSPGYADPYSTASDQGEGPRRGAREPPLGA